MYLRQDTIPVKVGNIQIGGQNKVVIQSMTNTKTSNVEKTLNQVLQLHKAGCEIVRLAVPDGEAVEALPSIIKQSQVPLVADIHFDYKLAIASIEAGISKIRINPGNIGSSEKIKEIIQKAKHYCIPIRIGVNTGSIPQHNSNPVASAIQIIKDYLEFFENQGFMNLVVSLKSSSVKDTIKLNTLFARKYRYPLHLGITEAGYGSSGIVKSTLGIGSLLMQGVGDTVRVSLSGDPYQEIPVAQSILRNTGLYNKGVEIISCPTCSRTDLKIEKLAKEVALATKNIERPLKIAVMGCTVNGPGEAKEADFGVCGGAKDGLVFAKGSIVKKVSSEKLIEELLKVIAKENL